MTESTPSSPPLSGPPPAAAQPGLSLAGVGIALLCIAGALVATVALRPMIPHTQFIVFYAAVMVAAYVGGLRLAALATVVSLVVVEVVVLGDAVPADSTSRIVIRNVMLAVISLGAALLVDRLRSERQESELRRHETESLAASLREQARQLKQKVAESEALASDLEDANVQLQRQTAGAELSVARSLRLQHLTNVLLATTGEEAVARAFVQEARSAVEAKATLIAMLRDDDSVEVIAVDDDDSEAFNAELLFIRPSPLFDVIGSGAAIWVEDGAAMAEEYPDFSTAAGASAYRRWVALPLQAERRQLGVLLFSFEAYGAFTPEDRSFMLLLAQQCAQAMERARLHETTFRARIRAEFAERRLSFLADASARLSESLDYDATLAGLARLVVPDLADWCLVYLRDTDDAPRLVAVVHADPDRVAARQVLEERYPGSSRAVSRFDEVIATGEARHVPRVTDELLRSFADNGEHLEVLRSFGLRSQIVVPISVEDRVWGTITLVSAESGRVFGEADVTLAAELGRRAGQAVENARLYQTAHHASEAKSDFLAVMSHELRTPLNAIIGYADLLLLGVPNEVPDRARRQVERIRSASNSLLQLVEEVLSFSRIEAGKEEIRISPVDLSALLRDCVALIEPMAAEKSLSTRLVMPDEPLKVISDERKIRQILTNLLSNAVKFTESGWIEAGIEVTDNSMMIRITDTGIGIPPEHLERIFDAFWQVEQTATRRFGGTGLGLGVARKLAKLLEGRLEVDSEVGAGSTFTLALPRHTPGMGRGA
ncbi:hypothetical protein BH23GEM9_BH23GEM9_35090 [soil metagenome]